MSQPQTNASPIPLAQITTIDALTNTVEILNDHMETIVSNGDVLFGLAIRTRARAYIVTAAGSSAEIVLMKEANPLDVAVASEAGEPKLRCMARSIEQLGEEMVALVEELKVMLWPYAGEV